MYESIGGTNGANDVLKGTECTKESSEQDAYSSHLTSTYHSNGIEGVEHSEEEDMVHGLVVYFWDPTCIVGAYTIGGPVGGRAKL